MRSLYETMLSIRDMSPTAADPAELASMLATLCSYDNFFGPRHPQTLLLMAEVADAYWRAGEEACARPLLERVVRDLGGRLGADHPLRLRALASLRDMFVGQGEYERAAAVRRELVKCEVRRCQ